MAITASPAPGAGKVGVGDRNECGGRGVEFVMSPGWEGVDWRRADSVSASCDPRAVCLTGEALPSV